MHFKKFLLPGIIAWIPGHGLGIILEVKNLPHLENSSYTYPEAQNALNNRHRSLVPNNDTKTDSHKLIYTMVQMTNIHVAQKWVLAGAT